MNSFSLKKANSIQSKILLILATNTQKQLKPELDNPNGIHVNSYRLDDPALKAVL